MTLKLFFLSALLAGLLFGAGSTAGQTTDPTMLIVGTGPVGGTYYEVGGALCLTINETRSDHGLRCLVESTAGSEENLRRLRDGDLDLALIQSDWQYFAARDGQSGGDEPEEKAGGLKALLSLHSQTFTLLVAPASGIAALADLEDKRLNLGPAGSATRVAGEALIRALGWDPGDFEAVADLAPGPAAAALCDGGLDALLLPASHPNAVVAGAAERCGARLVPIEGPAVDLLLASWPFYAPAEVPGGLYRSNPDAVRSFGLRATLVSRAGLPDPAAFEVARRLIEGLEGLRGRHPALSGLTPEGMVGLANSLDVHPGASRYYRSKGLVVPVTQ